MIRLGFLRDFGVANLILCLIWLVAVISGLGFLMDYESRPGENAFQSTRLPVNSELLESKTVPTVIMFIHPHCPCTRASVSEFQRVHSVCCNDARFKIVAFDPVGADADWRESDLVETAISIPDVSLVWDLAGRQGREINIKTSGHVLAFDAGGQLRFSGGITGSRGHEGDSAGSSALIRWLRQSGMPSNRNESPSVEVIRTPVFGCSLFDESETTCNE
jgi:hypothetical protein